MDRRTRAPGRRWPPLPLRWPEPPLSDGVVVLDRMCEADLPALVAACNDPAIQRWLPIPKPYTEADARHYLGAQQRHADAGTRLTFALRRAGNPALAGMISLRFRDLRECAIGYWTAPAWRGQGLTARAVTCLAGHAFAAYGAGRVELLIQPDNAASRRTAERAGAVLEGVRRNGILFEDRGQVFDCCVYSLVPTDLSR